MSKRCCTYSNTRFKIIRGATQEHIPQENVQAYCNSLFTFGPNHLPHTARTLRSNTQDIVTRNNGCYNAYSGFEIKGQLLYPRLVKLSQADRYRFAAKQISDEFKSFFHTIFYGCSRGSPRRGAVAPSTLRVHWGMTTLAHLNCDLATNKTYHRHPSTQFNPIPFSRCRHLVPRSGENTASTRCSSRR